MDDDFVASMAQAQKKPLSERKQKKAGKAVKGQIEEEHKNFLTTLFSLLDSGDVNPDEPKSFLKQEVYDGLSEEWQDKVDLALANLATQIRLIRDTRASAGTDESIHLQTQVEQLWQMKQQIEEHYDAFKF